MPPTADIPSTLACYFGVDAGSADPAVDPSTLPRTNATAAADQFKGQLQDVRTQNFESATLGFGGPAISAALLFSGGNPLDLTTAGAGQWIDVDSSFNLGTAGG